MDENDILVGELEVDVFSQLRVARGYLEGEVHSRLGFTILMHVLHDLATEQRLFLLEDCPEPLQAALLDVFRVIVGRARDDEDFFASSHNYLCHVADCTIGASYLLHAGVLSVFVAYFEDGHARRSHAIYLLCCALHSPRTRNSYVQLAIEHGLAAEVLAHLPTPDAAPEDAEQHAWNLALNWIGGSDLGARFLLPYVPQVIDALRSHGATQQSSVTLTLILANFSAFLDDDPEDRAALLRTGLADVLLTTAQSGDIRSGSVGALMGLINLRAHMGDEPLLAVDTRMISSLLQCLAFSLESRSQENILWSPWHPAQAIANLCLRRDIVPRLVVAGFVPLLARIVANDYEGNQAEPEKDELYAIKALALMSDAASATATNLGLGSILRTKATSARSSAAGAWASVVNEGFRGRLGYVLPLADLARRAYRHAAQREDFAEYMASVQTLALPRRLKDILSYGLTSLN
jgi:hypothetical protein